jgi:hypothetical protein
MSKIVRNNYTAPVRTELRFSVAAPGVEPKMYRYSKYSSFLVFYCLFLVIILIRNKK